MLLSTLITTQLNSQVIGLDLIGKSKFAETTFNYSSGFILVQVRFEGIFPMTFIFDTGAQNTILFDKSFAEILGIPYERRIRLMGADMSQSIDAYIARKVNLQLENCPIVSRDILVLDNDFLNLEELVGQQIHGIIGSDFFRNLVSKIDFRKGNLQFYNPSTFDPGTLKGYTEIPIKIQSNKPIVSAICNFGGGIKVPVNLLLDTGASLSCLINNDTDTLLRVPDNAIVGNLGHGLSGLIQGYVGKMENLEFSDFEFPGIITYFHDDSDIILEYDAERRNGIIGTHVLSRFTIVLDYIHQKLYLKPEKNYKKEFIYDRAGMTVYAFGENFRNFQVRYVVDGGPAHRAGIRVGDEIIRLGLMPAKFSTIDQINRKFTGKIGKKISLKLVRKNQSYTTSFRLEDLFDTSISYKRYQEFKNYTPIPSSTQDFERLITTLK